MKRGYLFPVPAGPLRSLLDAKAACGKAFTDEEAALDVMLALDRGDLKPLRYLAARWAWSKNRVHRSLADLTENAASWRSFHGSEAGQSLGQAGTRVGQAGTETGPGDTETPDLGTRVGQAGTRVGQYRTDPELQTQKKASPSEKPRARARAPAGKPEPVVLPNSIDAEAWADWTEHRREKGSPLKPTTVKHQLRQLATWTDAGHDPNAILRRSIANGWSGLFEPDAKRVDARTRADAARNDPRGTFQRSAAAALAALGA